MSTSRVTDGERLVDDQRGGMHRHLVAALGDEEGLAGLRPDGFLPPALWRAAVERTRLRDYPALAPGDGHWRVGADLARRYLESEAGRLVAATLPELAPQRAFAALLMPMAGRLRRAFEWDFEPLEVGGLIHLRGRRVLPAEHIAGFFQGLLERLRERHLVRVGSSSEDHLVLRVEPADGRGEARATPSA